MFVHSSFDAGNISLLEKQISADETTLNLDILEDNCSPFRQWFYFRLVGAKDQLVRLRFPNAHLSSYPSGWTGYQIRISEDGHRWTQLKSTSYDGQCLSAELQPSTNTVEIAYFAPYSRQRHENLITRSAAGGMSHEVLGESIQGRSIDLLTFGSGTLPWWIIARQHPGETMAEWWMEGLIEGLIQQHNPFMRRLLDQVTFYLVPNMNPDGSALGNLRTNAAGANLNREWMEPTLEQSPEVYLVRERMHQTGVDFCLDIHGDEGLPYNFVAGLEGIPSCTPELLASQHLFMRLLEQACPDFQTEHGYPINEPGTANLTVGSNYIAETFKCVALTLEQPFKDTIEFPTPETGWSPERAKHFGQSSIEAMWHWLEQRKG